MFSLRPIAVACGSDYSTPPTTPSPTPTPALTPGGATSAVTIQAVAEALGNDAYAPAELNVAVGTSVTWTNNDRKATQRTPTRQVGIQESSRLAGRSPSHSRRPARSAITAAFTPEWWAGSQ
jgi:hypothetical protein